MENAIKRRLRRRTHVILSDPLCGWGLVRKTAVYLVDILSLPLMYELSQLSCLSNLVGNSMQCWEFISHLRELSFYEGLGFSVCIVFWYPWYKIIYRVYINTHTHTHTQTAEANKENRTTDAQRFGWCAGCCNMLSLILTAISVPVVSGVIISVVVPITIS